MGLRTGWPWRRSGEKDIDQKIGFQCFRRWYMLSARVLLTFRSF
jgi:hypothetical protein